MKIPRSTFLSVVCVVAWAPANAQQPLWELGLGVGALALADYRGADTSAVLPIPIPYFVYRGEFLRADRDGLRGVFFNRDVVELNISAGATTPVNSGNSPARRGMPNLKPTLEVGTSIDWHIGRSNDRRMRLDFRMPLRAAMTVESSPRLIGWFFVPQLNLDLVDVGGYSGWDFGALAGPIYASRRYNQYFYTVAPQYSRPNRPAYQSPGGYSGTQVLASLTKRFPRFWVGAFARYDTLSGATFVHSPLVRSKGYWATGVGIAWLIGKSSTLVDAGEELQ